MLPSVVRRGGSPVVRSSALRAVSSAVGNGKSRSPSSFRFSPGHTEHGFKCVKTDKISELGIVVHQLKHEKTNAKLVVLAANDSNCAFSAGFATFPTDRTGVAHILEHTALAGSRAFPIRDPFFSMLPRSAATFMNAMTAADWTVYPFSTPNRTDFHNLLRVYTDAVYNPLLTRAAFAQEGHRMALDTSATAPAASDSGDKPVEAEERFKVDGVVFNEMKGALWSDAGAYFERELFNKLRPGTIYAHESGGDPVDIPNLTHEGLLQFHRRNYSPAGSHLSLYGDSVYPSTLAHLDNVLCERADRDAVDPMAIAGVAAVDPADLETITEPRPVGAVGVGAKEEVIWGSGPLPSVTSLEDPSTHCIVARGWLIPDSEDHIFKCFVMAVASRALLNHEFKEQLLDSGLGVGGFAPGTGYDTHCRENSFVVGLEGVAMDKVPEVLAIIDSVEKGILGSPNCVSSSRLEPVLRQVELETRSRSNNTGVNYLTSLIVPSVHGEDPAEALCFSKHADRLRAMMAEDASAAKAAADAGNPGVYRSAVAEMVSSVISSGRSLNYAMRYDPGFGEATKEAVRRKDEEGMAKMSEEDKEEARRAARGESAHSSSAGATTANAEGDVSCLPVLGLEDLLSDVRPDPSKYIGGAHVVTGPTNDLVYLRVGWDISGTAGSTPFGGVHDTVARDALQNPSSAPAEILAPLYPIFHGSLGAAGRSAADHSAHLDSLVAGHNFGIGSRRTSPVGPGSSVRGADLVGSLVARFDASDASVEAASGALAETVLEAGWGNTTDFTTNIRSFLSESNQSLAYNGHRFASSLAAAPLSESAAASEHVAGIAALHRLLGLPEEKHSELADALASNIQTIFNPANAHVSVVAGSEEVSRRVAASACGALGIPLDSEGSGRYQWGNIAPLPEPTKEQLSNILEMPFEVNHWAAVAKTAPRGSMDFAALKVLANILKSFYLHQEIREKGGAYGAQALVDEDGLFTMRSYRDPQAAATLQTFAAASQWARKASFTKEHVSAAKLSILGGYEAPVLPVSAGLAEWRRGVSDATRSSERSAVQAVTHGQVVEVANKYLTSFENIGAVGGASLGGLASKSGAEELSALGFSVLEGPQ